jgi:hypothetical protein
LEGLGNFLQKGSQKERRGYEGEKEIKEALSSGGGQV